MPTNVVKTPADERLWQKAKARAKEQGKADNYAYIMGIYKQMNPRMASAQRVAARFRDEDYVDLLQKKISLKEFLKKHPKIKAVDTQRLDALPESGLSRGYDYDCFVHAELRAVQLSEAKSYREVDWEPIGLDGAGANPPRGAEIPWSEAKKGDWVRWPGLGGHHGVVIDPNRKIVESCWGYKGTVFQHPVDYHPYGGGGKVFPVRPKVSAQRVAARYAASNPDMDALSRAIDDLSDGLADIMDHHSLQWRDTPGLAKAQSDIMHALSAYQDELEKFYSQEKARLEAERLERERLERAHQEKERQKKERHDTFKKLERLADKVFKDWARERGDGLSWMFSHSPGRFPTAEAAVEEYMKGAAKLLGGMPGIGKSNPKDPRRGGYIRAFLNNGRMFDIKINADIPPVERDGGSMADLALSIEQKE